MYLKLFDIKITCYLCLIPDWHATDVGIEAHAITYLLLLETANMEKMMIEIFSRMWSWREK